jgi:S1-C subfamily serine protease
LLILVLMLCSVASVAPAQTADERAMARAVVARRANAVISVTTTIRVRLRVTGRDMQDSDESIDSFATVLDESGLAVMSLSAVEPAGVITRQMTGMTGNMMALNIVTEPVSLRMRFGDGTQVTGSVVLRDEALDLAFVRPVDVGPTPVSFVDGTAGVPQAFDPVVVLTRINQPVAGTVTQRLDYIQRSLDKPVKVYVTGGLAGDGVLSAPVFDLAGRFVGVIVTAGFMAPPPANGTMTSGMLAPLRNAGGMRAWQVVVPASDIREIAKQAQPVTHASRK